MTDAVEGLKCAARSGTGESAESGTSGPVLRIAEVFPGAITAYPRSDPIEDVAASPANADPLWAEDAPANRTQQDA
jgi:hypothetical protein